MTRETLRNTLRNAVINETVNNLTQAICNQPCKEGEPTTGPRSFSLVSFADTEVFYGARNISMLREEAECQLATLPPSPTIAAPGSANGCAANWSRRTICSKTRPRRNARATAWLPSIHSNISASFVVEQNYEQLAEIRSRPSRTSRCCWRAPAHPRSPNREIPLSQEAALRRHTTDLLGYALVIQAAAVNRRLKQDMVDQDPSLGQQNLKIMSFFDPDAPAYVLDIFEKYVNTKWPLRVYAIEPVIANRTWPMPSAGERSRASRSLRLHRWGHCGP